MKSIVGFLSYACDVLIWSRSNLIPAPSSDYKRFFREILILESRGELFAIVFTMVLVFEVEC